MISNSIHNGSCYFLRLTLVVVCISNQDVWIVISIFSAKNSVSKTLANKTEIKSHWYSSVELHTYSIHVNDRSNSALLRLKMTDELLISKFPTTLRFLLSRCIPIIQQSIWNLKHSNERNKTRRDQITQDRNQYSPKKVKRIEIMRKLLAVCSKMNEWKSLSHSPTHLHSSSIHKKKSKQIKVILHICVRWQEQPTTRDQRWRRRTCCYLTLHFLTYSFFAFHN